MKITELVEARRNPEQNPKTPINQSIIDAVNNTANEINGVTNVFVSFTKIDKLGINPKSEYSTPLGIYAYPGEYIVNSLGANRPMRNLPFAGDEPYVNIFNARGNIVVLSSIDVNEAEKYYDKIIKVLAKEIGDLETARNQVNELVQKSSLNSKFSNLPGGRLWYVTMKVAGLMSDQTGSEEANSWNRLFRSIGIDGVIDMGVGIIHTSEPTQAVFFDINSIVDNKRFYNKYSPSDTQSARSLGAEDRVDSLKYGSVLRAMKDPSQVISFLDKNGLSYIKLIRDPNIRAAVLRKFPGASHYIKNPTRNDILTIAEDDTNISILADMIDKATEKEIISAIRLSGNSTSDSRRILFNALKGTWSELNDSVKLEMVRQVPPVVYSLINMRQKLSPGIIKYAIKFWDETKYGAVPQTLIKLVREPSLN